MPEEYATLTLETLGDVQDGRVGRQFQQHLERIIDAVISHESARNSTGHATGSMTITIGVEGLSARDMPGAPLTFDVQVNSKTPKARAAKSFLHMVDGEYVEPVGESPQPALPFSVESGGGDQ